jgi:hypothetical protein
MTAMMQQNWLWRLAEHADWYSWRPRWMWRALLAWQDSRNGISDRAVSPGEAVYDGPDCFAIHLNPRPANKDAA